MPYNRIGKQGEHVLRRASHEFACSKWLVSIRGRRYHASAAKSVVCRLEARTYSKLLAYLLSGRVQFGRCKTGSSLRSIIRCTCSRPSFSQSSAQSANNTLCRPGLGLIGSLARSGIPFPSTLSGSTHVQRRVPSSFSPMRVAGACDVLFVEGAIHCTRRRPRPRRAPGLDDANGSSRVY